MATVLVLEDSQVLLSKLTSDLKGAFPDHQILGARSLSEAQLLVAEYSVDVFIVDIFLPDGNGIDFLCDVKTTHPDASAVVMTAQQVPDFRQAAEDLGIVRYFQKPLDMPTLCGVVQSVIDPDAAAAAGSTDSFKASLSSLTTVDIIQLKCLARSTQVLKFTDADGQVGKIHFQKGEIIHALVDAESGERAFNIIVSWKGGQVEESPEPITSEPTIAKGWESLLMDAVRMIDEAAAGA